MNRTRLASALNDLLSAATKAQYKTAQDIESILFNKV